jgi:hypothetical protein
MELPVGFHLLGQEFLALCEETLRILLCLLARALDEVDFDDVGQVHEGFQGRGVLEVVEGKDIPLCDEITAAGQEFVVRRNASRSPTEVIWAGGKGIFLTR